MLSGVMDCHFNWGKCERAPLDEVNAHIDIDAHGKIWMVTLTNVCGYLNSIC